MGYYLRVVGQGLHEQVWRIDEQQAIRMGVSNPEQTPGSYFSTSGQESIWDAIRQRTPWLEENPFPFMPIDLEPRQYYRRIARPLSFSNQKYMLSPSAEREQAIVAQGIGQATTLMRRLDLICQTVHPEEDTLHVYGHEIRNLLILAATEVEAHWRGVLVANGSTRDQFSTRNYVRLLRPMRLDQYTLSFPSFPWLAAIKPFENWNTAEPTQSLPWYQAYNSVKHDREGAFREGRLDHAFNAVGACIIMLAAQFTRSRGLGGTSDLSTYFHFDEVPQWEAREIYCDCSEDGREWSNVQNPELS